MSVWVLHTADGIFFALSFNSKRSLQPYFLKVDRHCLLWYLKFSVRKKITAWDSELKSPQRGYIVKVFIDELGVLNCKTIQFSCSCGCLLLSQWEKIGTVGSNFSSYCNSTWQGIFPSILQRHTLSSTTPWRSSIMRSDSTGLPLSGEMAFTRRAILIHSQWY